MAMNEAPELPEEMQLKLERKEILRYGENPHQSAALYKNPLDPDRPSAANARKVQGKELSYNNLLDADAAFECVAEFSDPAAVIVKHMNPCGVAVGEKDILEAYIEAFRCDEVSAFGGIVAFNRELDGGTADYLIKTFLEVVIAPSLADDAAEVLSAKPDLRVLITGKMPEPSGFGISLRSISGGLLVQTHDNMTVGDMKVVTKRAPTDREWKDIRFAFTVCKHVKSNAIVYVKEGATLGIGAGQMSRIDSTRLAWHKAKHANLSLEGSVMASDAFFPFPDVVEEAAKAGAAAIIQPGGSKNDRESIDAADKHSLAMVFTGVRHFRH